jgi:hypothetical protein
MQMSDFANAVILRHEAAHEAAVADLAKARARLAEVQALFDQDRSKHRRASLLEAQTDLESAERVHAKNIEDLEKAREAAARLERERQRAELDALEKRLADWPAAVQDAARRLLDVDRQITSIVKDVAKARRSSADTYARADLLSSQIGRQVSFRIAHSSPSLADARLAVQRMLTAARLSEDGRPSFGPEWLATASLDQASFSAAEIAIIESFKPLQDSVINAMVEKTKTEAAMLAGAQAAAAALTEGSES